MADEKWAREVARLSGFDIRSDEHGGLCMGGCFEFEGSGQGLGYRIDIEFVQKLMEVFGVMSLRDVNGKHAWVTHSRDDVKLIEPLRSCEGTAFDIHKWAQEARERSRVFKAL